MRKASKALGIAGGVLSLVFAAVFIIAGIFVATAGSDFITDVLKVTERYYPLVWAQDILTTWAGSFVGIILFVWGVFSVAAGVLGIVGGLLASTKNTTAGVLLIVAAGLKFFTYGWVTMILFTLAGIFSLIKEKPQAPPV